MPGLMINIQRKRKQNIHGKYKIVIMAMVATLISHILGQILTWVTVPVGTRACPTGSSGWTAGS